MMIHITVADVIEKELHDVYLHGLEHSLRKVAWRLLLSVCPADTTGQERFHLLDVKAQQYASLKENWKKLYASGLMSEYQLSTLASISIDVVRTDWSKCLILLSLQMFHMILILNYLISTNRSL
ncbi:unnamed protein product [Trichobilharzia regenti]|nr:unnamed protein product [Trichobilharzia regenti]